jgi:hypothetical protein
MLEFKPLLDLADKLGIIQAVKNKLISQPDPAVEKFVTTLSEISRIYSATESELARYLSVYFDQNDSSQNQEERNTLISLESGVLTLRWNEARGHCHKILNIYEKYLNKWFSKVLKPEENEQMKNLFFEFGKFEGGFLENLDSITTWLADEASQTLSLLDDGKISEANARIRDARSNTLLFRKQMTNAMGQMIEVQAEFIRLTGAV